MKDGIIKADGTSRLLRATLPESYEEFRAMAGEGTLPLDVLFNAAGWRQSPTFLNKAALLKDTTAAMYGLTDAAVPDDVLRVLTRAVTRQETYDDGSLSMEDYSWEEIIAFANAGTLTDHFPIGSEKTFTLSWGAMVKAKIIATNHDILTNGHGNARYTFIMSVGTNSKSESATLYMNPSNTNVGGWGASAMRSDLASTVLLSLPEELQAAILPVNKLTSAGNKLTTLETTSDKLWLPSFTEMGFTSADSAYSPGGEGTAYAYFDSVEKRKGFRTFGSLGGTTPWSTASIWTRSPSTGTASQFFYVNTDGTCKISSAHDYAYTACFGFCLGDPTVTAAEPNPKLLNASLLTILDGDAVKQTGVSRWSTLKDITVTEAVEQLEIDLSDIDFSKYKFVIVYLTSASISSSIGISNWILGPSAAEMKNYTYDSPGNYGSSPVGSLSRVTGKQVVSVLPVLHNMEQNIFALTLQTSSVYWGYTTHYWWRQVNAFKVNSGSTDSQTYYIPVGTQIKLLGVE